MKAALLILTITAVTLVIAYYAVGAVNPSGICSADWSEAQIIREHCRLRLIRPEWVSSKGSVLMNWVVAETKARLAVVTIFWIAAVSFAIRCELGGNENVDSE